MNTKDLKDFLVASNLAGYATGSEKKWTKEPDGSTTIHFEKGSWRSHDNFFGGEPYGGRIIVFYKNKPYWMMVYYGWVTEGVEPNSVYEILRGALKQMPKEYPFRGPKKYNDDDYGYDNSWKGNVERYSGEEKITHGKQLVYKANYVGGLVDQRKGV